MRYIRYALDFLLYSHIFIVCCALATIHLTALYIQGFSIAGSYYLFVGAGTLIVYNLHRLLSLQKILTEGLAVKERYLKIRKYRSWYIQSSVLAFFLCIYGFITFNFKIQVLLILPSILSILYIYPLFPGHKRLRDYNFLKIFLIAFCWAWLCCYVPLAYSDISIDYKVLIGIEKVFFVTAITLPFDFRDLELDHKQSVETLVSAIGYKKSMVLSLSLLGSSLLILAILTFSFDVINLHVFYGMSVAYLFTGFILAKAFKHHSDYYYSFLVDGTFILCLLCVLLFSIWY